jgi:hypothetical protein
MFLIIYLLGVAITWYIFHRKNIKNELENIVNTGDERRAIEDPGTIFMMGFFWPLVCLVEGVTWVADPQRNGYQAYVEAQAKKIQDGEDTLQGRWDKLKDEEARLATLIDEAESAQPDDKTSI